MRACILTVAALVLLAGGTGCHGINLAHHGRNQCDQCGNGHGGRGNGGLLHHGGHGAQGGGAYAGGGAYGGGGGGYAGGGHVPTRGTPGVPHHFTREYNGPQGPQTPQVAYPYYTTRGPRDFLVDNPPSIGGH